MTGLIADEFQSIQSNPLDMVEDLASANDWGFSRASDDEITLMVNGSYCDMELRFFWRTDLNTLQFICMFDARVPEEKLIEIYQTIGLLNERMWLGHFDYWTEEGALMFRHASLTDASGVGPGEDHLATLIETALGECERFYPVIQFVLWGNRSPKEAIEAAMLDCVGNA